MHYLRLYLPLLIVLHVMKKGVSLGLVMDVASDSASLDHGLDSLNTFGSESANEDLSFLPANNWSPDSNEEEPLIFENLDDDEISSSVAEDLWNDTDVLDSKIIPGINELSSCDAHQPLGRIRVRSDGDFCVESRLPDPPKEGFYFTPPVLATDEEIKRYFCPTESFQGILNIPVCATYDDFLIGPADVFSLTSMLPLSNTKLKNLRMCSLMTPWNYALCSEMRAYCCQEFLPDVYQVPDVASMQGRGFYCARTFGNWQKRPIFNSGPEAAP